MADDQQSEIRILLATGAAAPSSDAIPRSVLQLLTSASEVLVLTPVLANRLQWLVSDVDQPRHEADERLATVLGHMEETGVKARGTVGDENPLSAFEDAVESFNPSHIVIAMRPRSATGWQESGLTEQVLERFDLPVTAFHLAE